MKIKKGRERERGCGEERALRETVASLVIYWSDNCIAQTNIKTDFFNLICVSTRISEEISKVSQTMFRYKSLQLNLS